MREGLSMLKDERARVQEQGEGCLPGDVHLCVFTTAVRIRKGEAERENIDLNCEGEDESTGCSTRVISAASPYSSSSITDTIRHYSNFYAPFN